MLAAGLGNCGVGGHPRHGVKVLGNRVAELGVERFQPRQEGRSLSEISGVFDDGELRFESRQCTGATAPLPQIR